MSESAKVEVTIEEREPTAQELNLMAAKQLLTEILMIKRRIQESKTLLNGMLIAQVRFVLNGLIKKYNNVGLLLGETVELKLTGYKPNDTIYFNYSSGLKELFDQVVDQETKKQEEEKQ
jgi:hypothetical protein